MGQTDASRDLPPRGMGTDRPRIPLIHRPPTHPKEATPLEREGSRGRGGRRGVGRLAGVGDGPQKSSAGPAVV